jgi:hypothetical protein
MARDFYAELQQIGQTATWAAGAARQALEEARRSGNTSAVERIVSDHRQMVQELTDLRNVVASLKMDRIGGGNGTPDIQRIENIPGERVPFDFLVEIPIEANDTSVRQGTITVSMEGPFVAVARFCTFLSQYQFQVTSPDTGEITTFLGRSNGRFRPIHSAADINDAILPADVMRIVAVPGTGDPSYASPSNHASYRTMEGDFRITMRKQDSQFPRSNVPVPSPFWTTFINSPFPLGALDFFPRSSVIEFSVQPQHTNNPRNGNLQAYGAGGIFPFIDSQFDQHEGIMDPENNALVAGDPDPVTRLPRGVLIIGLHGYRILQPPGAVVNLASV